MKPCNYTEDGYCIRPENDYCRADECKGCSHENKLIRVVASVVNCETIQEYCANCGAVLYQQINCE